MDDHLNVGIIAPIFNNMPIWVGIERGLFAAAGLDVTAEVLYGVQNVTDAVLSGRVQVGIGTAESVLHDAGADLLIIGGNARKLANGLIARPGFETVEQLRGATIGVSHPSEGTALLVAEMLARHGLNAGDFTIKAIGVASARWDAIRVGELDAGLQTPPHKYIAEDEGYPNLGDVSDYVPDYQFASLNVRADWAPAHRPELTRFLEVVAAATEWMYDRREETIALAEEAMRTSADYAERDYDHFVATQSLTTDVSLSPLGMAKVVEVMTRAGTITPEVAATWADRADLSYLPATL